MNMTLQFKPHTCMPVLSTDHQVFQKNERTLVTWWHYRVSEALWKSEQIKQNKREMQNDNPFWIYSLTLSESLFAESIIVIIYHFQRAQRWQLSFP